MSNVLVRVSSTASVIRRVVLAGDLDISREMGNARQKLATGIILAD